MRVMEWPFVCAEVRALHDIIIPDFRSHHENTKFNKLFFNKQKNKHFVSSHHRNKHIAQQLMFIIITQNKKQHQLRQNK